MGIQNCILTHFYSKIRIYVTMLAVILHFSIKNSCHLSYFCTKSAKASTLNCWAASLIASLLLMYLYNQTISSCRNTGQCQRSYITLFSRCMRWIDYNWQTAAFFTTGTAETSSVFLVAVSKVRIPLSHNTTL